VNTEGHNVSEQPVARIEIDMAADAERRDGMFVKLPPQVAESGKDYTAVLHTDQGDITVQLYNAKAPVTVNNFLYLALTGFYDDTTFHRVIEGFMAQGGDPSGSGRGGPGYRFKDEFSRDLLFNSPYLLAMANSGPHNNGSQFFITFVPTPHLNHKHSIFGKVIEGMAAVNNISNRDPMSAVAPGDKIKNISIFARDASD
jgi:cyclophilin family peptidyl-prolyl cis-trans isomerase